jgi:hypothetical protein
MSEIHNRLKEMDPSRMNIYNLIKNTKLTKVRCNLNSKLFKETVQWGMNQYNSQ